MSGKILVLLLVLVVLLLLALPMGMGMAMGPCPNGTSSMCPSVVGGCATVVAAVALLTLGLMIRLPVVTPRAPALLLIRPLERPPRSSS